MTRARNLSWPKSDRPLDYLESATKGVLDTTKGLSDVQSYFKPARSGLLNLISQKE